MVLVKQMSKGFTNWVKNPRQNYLQRLLSDTYGLSKNKIRWKFSAA